MRGDNVENKCEYVALYMYVHWKTFLYKFTHKEWRHTKVKIFSLPADDKYSYIYIYIYICVCPEIIYFSGIHFHYRSR